MDTLINNGKSMEKRLCLPPALKYHFGVIILSKALKTMTGVQGLALPLRSEFVTLNYSSLNARGNACKYPTFVLASGCNCSRVKIWLKSRFGGKAKLCVTFLVLLPSLERKRARCSVNMHGKYIIFVLCKISKKYSV